MGTAERCEPADQARSERGAALIATLLISTLLLGIGGTLLLSTALEATNAVVLTSETQAYYAAEAGLQAAVNVLRGNVPPNASMPSGTTMNFRNAVTRSVCNLSSDSSTGPLRLSAWLTYNSGVITAGDISYKIVLQNPDDPTNAKLSDPAYVPSRLWVQSMGRGPNGSKKVLEMMVQRNTFDYNPKATILVRGATDGSGGTINVGSSNADTYSGADAAGTGTTLPIFGVTNTADQNTVNSNLTKGTITGDKSTLLTTTDLPTWLQTPGNATTLLNRLQALSTAAGRDFDNSTGFPSDAGTTSSPKLTFFAGTATIGPGFSGAGLLIVTGDLTVKGNFSFDGLIMVLGSGQLQRNGGGNGTINGAIVDASFNSTLYNDPIYDTSGGGNSTIQFDSSWVKKALVTLPPQVIAVSEQ